MLNNLGELVTETRAKVANHFSSEDVILPDQFKMEFERFYQQQKSNILFNERSAVITNSEGKKIYVPNQWFYLAGFAVDLVQEIIKYRQMTEIVIDQMIASQMTLLEKKDVYKKLRENQDIEFFSLFLQAVEQFCPELESPDEMEKTKEYLGRFVSDYNWWLGGKGIERTNDYFVSPALSVLNLVNASQNYVASLAYYYATDPKLYSALKNDMEEKEATLSGENILLYGVPGAGKSYTVKRDYTKDSPNVERVVFHPDYSYSDFVGQIMPVVHEDKSVSYSFVAGPFTRLLKAAWENPNDQYWLIIEEINRGNAPAIFGDLFQLLDRNDDGSSEYEITNADIAEQLFNDRTRKVGLPGNFSIIATMNTSDQNVFTLDTAFQRRWQMRMIDNDFDACTDTDLMDTTVLDTGVKWKDFAKVINKSIVEANAANMISTADKQLGTHFVSKHELKSKSEVFAEKVLKYLWDDAVKMNPDKVFSPEYKELRLVIKDFNNETGSNKLNVFNKKIRTALQEIVDGLSTGEVSGDVVGPQDGSDDN